jgi:hypothetical protein
MILQLLTSNIHTPIHMSSITLQESLFYYNTIARLTAQKLQQENKRQNKTKQNKKQNDTKTPGPMVTKSAVVLFQISLPQIVVLLRTVHKLQELASDESVSVAYCDTNLFISTAALTAT